MINDKKGMSAVIIMVIMIALALVAIGIVWFVVGGMIQKGAGSADIQAKCLGVDLEITSVVCGTSGDGGTNDCATTVQRKDSGEAIGGLKAIYSKGIEKGKVLDYPGTMETLASKKLGPNSVGLMGVNNVEITVYFNDEAGVELICPQIEVSKDIEPVTP